MMVRLKVVAITASACISMLHGGELPDGQTVFRRWPWNHNVDDINCEEEIPQVCRIVLCWTVIPAF